MSTIEYTRGRLAERQVRFKRFLEIKEAAWHSNAKWVGKTISFIIPDSVRSRVDDLQLRHGFKSMTETVVKALLIGLDALEEIAPPRQSTARVTPIGISKKEAPRPIPPPAPDEPEPTPDDDDGDEGQTADRE